MTEISDTVAEYQSCMGQAREKIGCNELEAALDYVRTGAWAAWKNPAIWDSIRADEILTKVAEKLEQQDGRVKTSTDDRNGVVFVASSLADHGGHSESMRLVIDYLVQNTEISVEAVLLTNVDNTESEFPELQSTLEALDVDILQLSPDATYVSRIAEMADYLNSTTAERGVLLINPDDVIAISALPIVDDFQSYLYNHADHVFWIGGHVVDYVVDARTEGAVITQEYRNLSSTGVISLTSDIKPSAELPADFPISRDTTFSISVGTEYKFKLDGGRAYSTAIESLLRENPDLHHILITDGDAASIREEISIDLRGRFHIAGPYPNLSPVYTSADILVDSIPFGGSMVRLEAILCETPVLAYINPEYPFVGNNDIIPPDHELVTHDEGEVAEYAKRILNQDNFRNEIVARQSSYCQPIFDYDSVGARWEALLQEDLDQKVVPELRLEPSTAEPTEQIKLGDFSFRDYRSLIAEHVAKRSPGGFPSTFDMEGYSSFLDLRDGTQKRLLRQLVTKSTSAKIDERIQVFRRAYSGDELDSPGKVLGYGALAIAGNAAYPVFKFAEERIS